jgi:Icc-related predicted phosphoesterase
MQILYVTDLHGNVARYERLIEVAQKLRPDVVINGGDMLPKDGDLHEQGAFITRYLVEHFSYFEQTGIPYLCCLGNDDLAIWDELFGATCCLFDGVYDVAQQKVSLGGLDFIGMNWVADYPFLLKDRCRMDTADFIFPPQRGRGVLSKPDGFLRLDDWPAYARQLPTLEQELARLPEPDSPDQAVYIIHMPPATLGLDVCGGGEAVGSKAVYNFLASRQPRFSFHGHIHESPEVSGVWRAEIGHTLCIQPGQLAGLTYALVDTVSKEAERRTDPLA